MNVSPKLLYVAMAAMLYSPAYAENDSSPDGIWVRPGYELIVAEETIEQPRFMQVNPNGTLYLSLPGDGEIKSLFDNDKDGKYEKIVTYVEGYDTVHGLDWHDGWLWFSQTGAIYKSRDTDNDGKADEVIKVIKEDQVPSEGGGHWWRAVLIHNDRIYTSIGDPSNFTDGIEKSERCKLWTFALDGTDKQLFSSGLRNTEKFDVRPGTDEIWGCDHDIDKLYEKIEKEAEDSGQPFTDVNPNAELNKYVKGGYYGHPYILANRHPHPDFISRETIVELAAKTIVPEWLMPAHCSANGMTFYNHDHFPGDKGNAFVAMKGSWNNKEQKVGYCLTRILFEYGRPYGSQKMVNFLTDDEQVMGRPADVTVDLDGSLLISDDNQHRIYRLRYAGK